MTHEHTLKLPDINQHHLTMNSVVSSEKRNQKGLFGARSKQEMQLTGKSHEAEMMIMQSPKSHLYSVQNLDIVSLEQCPTNKHFQSNQRSPISAVSENSNDDDNYNTEGGLSMQRKKQRRRNKFNQTLDAQAHHTTSF